ncbi:hypothetical protein B0H16DRAFT_1540186, partial [Mycena metata]
ALERDRTTVAAELYSKATFPVLTLPVEITTAIFTFCLPTIEELHENNIRRRDDAETPPTLTAPNTLVECCRAWRDIAFATPSLWTTLALCLKDNDFFRYPDHGFGFHSLPAASVSCPREYRPQSGCRGC